MIECVILPALEMYVIGKGESSAVYIVFLGDYYDKIQFGKWTVCRGDDGFVRNDEMVTWGGIKTKKVKTKKLIYYYCPLEKNRRTSQNGTRQKSK